MKLKPFTPNTRYILVAALWLAAVTLPYLWAAGTGAGQYVFGGILINPQDGNSYLAKMMQGWQGAWDFRLPYTAQAGDGAPLFLFYLLLGHLARLGGFSLVFTFHLARLLSGLVLVLVLARFMRVLFPADADTAWRAWCLAVFGSGLGWLAAPLAGITADFWVAEAFPFLSTFSNPHFCLGLGLFLLVLLWLREDETPVNLIRVAVVGVVLAVVNPLSVGLVLGVIALWTAWNWLEERRLVWKEGLVFGLGGGGVLLYQYWVINHHPVLSGWNAQNQTLTPPVWDVVVSLSPVLLLAVWGMVCLARQPGGLLHATEGQRLVLSWLVVAGVLMFIPLALQRRFMSGIYVPLVILGFWGWRDLPFGPPKRRGVLITVVILSLLTNVFLLVGAWGAVRAYNPKLFVATNEAAAFEWINDHARVDALVLAAPETGMFIPAYTGRRVIYGHPFETVNAAEEEARVAAFFGGAWDNHARQAFLKERQIDYVFFGSREQKLSGLTSLPYLTPVFQNGNVILYAAR